jgi:[citrate (pro-3S)-lyase] ligase
MIAELNLTSERERARALIEASGLVFDGRIDVMVGIYEEERLIATGSRAGNILKMLAVAPDHQGGPVFGELLTELVMNGHRAGHESLFAYTRPESAATFQSLNFSLLARQDKVILLEYGQGFSRWLDSKRDLIHPGKNGAVVLNGNPFTNGHRHLIESAAREVDRLYVFVVREERSVFPFDIRYRLIGQGLRHVANAIVLDTSCYMVSNATFPTYFLKKDDPVARIQMELDLDVFASRIAPCFGIVRRFVGSEPECALTHAYNQSMQRLLPARGIDLQIIERKRNAAGVISASRVRELAGRGNFAALSDCVPATTLSYLESDAAAPVRERLRAEALASCVQLAAHEIGKGSDGSECGTVDFVVLDDESEALFH